MSITVCAPSDKKKGATRAVCRPVRRPVRRPVHPVRISYPYYDSITNTIGQYTSVNGWKGLTKKQQKHVLAFRRREKRMTSSEREERDAEARLGKGYVLGSHM